MERRSEPRFKTRQLVEITVLGDQHFTAPAMLADVSLHGMGLLTNRPVPLHAKVKIAFSNDEALMGETSRCTPGDDGFIVGLRLSQALTDVGKATNLERKLFAILRDILISA